MIRGETKHIIIEDAVCLPVCNTNYVWGMSFASDRTPAKFFLEVLSKHTNAETLLRCAPHIYCLVGMQSSDNITLGNELKWKDYPLTEWQKEHLDTRGSCVLAFLLYSECEYNPEKVAWVELIDSYLPKTKYVANRLIEQVEYKLGKKLIFRELSVNCLAEVDIWNNNLLVDDEEELKDYLNTLGLDLENVGNWELLFAE